MKNLISFTQEDFNIFYINGLESRMAKLKEQIRPKFEAIGQEIAPYLTVQLEEPVTTHIAKHARRTVNPPDETWVAWSTNKRGYKAHPHFQLGLNKDYVFICFALIYEYTKKPLFASHLRRNLDNVWTHIPDHFFVSSDHTKPISSQKKDIDQTTLDTMLNRLKKVKQTEFLCGLHIARKDLTDLHENILLRHITDTLKTLHPLYLLTKEGDAYEKPE